MAVAYVDDVHLTADQPTGLNFGFETSVDNWAINNENPSYNTALANGLAISTAEASGGTHSLKADFNLGGGEFQIRLSGAQDLSSATSLTAKIKIMPGTTASFGSGLKVKLFLQSGDSWSWFDSGEITYSGSDFITATFNLSSVTNKDKIKAIGIQLLTPANSAGTATVYIDDVKQE
jgi:hypothetical protein